MDLSALQVGPLIGSLGDAVRPFLSGEAFSGRNGTMLVVAAAFIGYRFFGFLIGVTLRLVVAVVRLFVAVPMVGATGLINDLTALVHRFGGQRRASLIRPVVVALLVGAGYYAAQGHRPLPAVVDKPVVSTSPALKPRCEGDIVDLNCPRL